MQYHNIYIKVRQRLVVACIIDADALVSLTFN